MDIFSVIKRRRSIRKYKNCAVEDDKLNKVLEAGRLAPSANNRQEWRFVVVRDPQVRERLMAAACNQRFVAQAPVVIACCSVEDSHIMTCGHAAYAIDVAIAIDHMTLAAAGQGLGTCWIGAFYESRVREILSVPERVRIVELLTLGYPDEQPGARPRKALGEIVYWEKWGRGSK